MAVCLVLGDPVTNTFVIEINPEIRKTKQISHIREIIFNDNVNTFFGIDAKNIKLWKVTISTSERNEKLEIYKYFDEQPTSGHIHIIVQPPTARGLGGTTYQGKEHGVVYEGVDLTLGTICKRESTIDRLLECLLERYIILVRSPQIAGKTMEGRSKSWTFAERFKKLMNMIWDEFINKCGDILTFLIIDEVQKIYKPENVDKPRHGGNVFWDSFKYILQSSSLHIVAFASYGHYGAYTSCGDHTIMNISLCSLQKCNTWGFEDVHFTSKEFNCYFNHFCEENLQMLKKEDLLLLSCYMSEITAFHPSLVFFTMNQIHMRFIKYTFEPLTFTKVFTYLKSHNFNDHFK
ncbi:17499_t:CDS:2, partial [Dentiscutata erythropus]